VQGLVGKSVVATGGAPFGFKQADIALQINRNEDIITSFFILLRQTHNGSAILGGSFEFKTSRGFFPYQVRGPEIGWRPTPNIGASTLEWIQSLQC
jgi:hypothetical protein